MRIPFLLFIIVPLIEMWVLIEVGSLIGGFTTVGLVVLTAFIGINLLRMQGMQTLQRFQSKASHGELPGQEIVEGMMLAIAGALLLTPGFVTDTIGFVLLVPGIRARLFKQLGSRISMMGAAGRRGFGAGGFQSGGAENSPFGADPFSGQSVHQRPDLRGGDSASQSSKPQSHNTLEGEFHEEESNNRK